VNISQRLQELGKLLAPDTATAIAISGETVSRLDEKFETIPAGKHRLRGRGEATEVFQLGKVATSASPRLDVHRAPKQAEDHATRCR
jgi:adenylate cyclase